jgi:kynurenine formamidase
MHSQPLLTLAGLVFRTIDLTQELSAATPMFESSEPSLTYKTRTTVARDGYRTGEFHMAEHCGTHIDAPSHFIEGAPSLEQIPAQRLIVPAIVIDVREQCRVDHDYALTIEDVNTFEKKHGITSNAAILLLTGWSSRFADEDLYRNADQKGIKHFPGFGAKAIEYLIDDRKVSALGIDTLSVDRGRSQDFEVHRFALSKNVLLVENLVNLDQLPPVGATVFFGPIKLKDGTGGPLRVLALTPSS